MPRGVRTRLPPVPEHEIILFHWSPMKNRKSIEKVGLCPGKLSPTGMWKPPFVCMGDDPNLAWILSGHMWPEVKAWDLWMCNLEHQDSFDHYEIITDTYPSTGRAFVKEYRIYTRIYKRDLIYLATRRQ